MILTSVIASFRTLILVLSLNIYILISLSNEKSHYLFKKSSPLII